jgi:hypothetical protein
MSLGPPSTTVPSSITDFTLPKRTSEVCGTWQLSVFSIGLTYFSQLHPGSSVALAIVKPPRFTSSIFYFSELMVSSRELKLFVCNFDTISLEVSIDSLYQRFISWPRRESIILQTMSEISEIHTCIIYD